MVNYSPQQDPTIPCADAGVAFRKGDILEIVDQTDALWWQARKLPSTACCAGLVPSTSLLQRWDSIQTPPEKHLFARHELKKCVSVRKQRELWWSQPYLPHTCMHICKPHLFPSTCQSQWRLRPQLSSPFLSC